MTSALRARKAQTQKRRRPTKHERTMDERTNASTPLSGHGVLHIRPALSANSFSSHTRAWPSYSRPNLCGTHSSRPSTTVQRHLSPEHNLCRATQISSRTYSKAIKADHFKGQLSILRRRSAQQALSKRAVKKVAGLQSGPAGIPVTCARQITVSSQDMHALRTRASAK